MADIVAVVRMTGEPPVGATTRCSDLQYAIMQAFAGAAESQQQPSSGGGAEGRARKALRPQGEMTNGTRIGQGNEGGGERGKSGGEERDSRHPRPARCTSRQRESCAWEESGAGSAGGLLAADKGGGQVQENF